MDEHFLLRLCSVYTLVEALRQDEPASSESYEISAYKIPKPGNCRPRTAFVCRVMQENDVS
jgi:hypothetical protein